MADPKSKLYEVVDSSCTHARTERIHDLVMDGKVKQVKFVYGEKTMLPFAEAMKFQKEGFQVLDDSGSLIARAPETPIDSALKLGPDQVIANLSELTADALYARAVSLPDGEKLKANSGRDKLIGFLTQTTKVKTAPGASDPTEIAEMAEGELDKMGLADA